MRVPVAVWQPCELLYTCYLLTHTTVGAELHGAMVATAAREKLRRGRRL